MSHNPITGAKIATKPSKTYSDHFDAIFRSADEELSTKILNDQCCPMCDVVVVDEE